MVELGEGPCAARPPDCVQAPPRVIGPFCSLSLPGPALSNQWTHARPCAVPAPPCRSDLRLRVLLSPVLLSVSRPGSFPTAFFLLPSSCSALCRLSYSWLVVHHPVPRSNQPSLQQHVSYWLEYKGVFQ